MKIEKYIILCLENDKPDKIRICMNILARIFAVLRGRCSTRLNTKDDNDPKHKEQEIDEPKFTVTLKNADTQHFEYTFVVEKPNCCYICKQLLHDSYSCPEGEEEIISNQDCKSNLADLSVLCKNWKSWEAWESRSSKSEKAELLKIALETVTKDEYKHFRRYCKPCVTQTLFMQMEDQRGTVFDLATKSVKFKCLFCQDFSTKHHIQKVKVLEFLDDGEKELFTVSYNRFIAEHDVRNKHCPIPDCRYFASTSNRIDCPEHGKFCTSCFEKVEITPHKCPGVHRELLELDCLRRCPSCMSLVEKRGGCDHMTCACGHNFYWNQLKPLKRKKVRKVKKE